MLTTLCLDCVFFKPEDTCIIESNPFGTDYKPSGFCDFHRTHSEIHNKIIDGVI